MIRPKKTKGRTLSAIRVHLKDTELPYATLIADPEPYVGYMKAEDGFTLYSPLRTEKLVCESLFADVSNRKRIAILNTRTFETVAEYVFNLATLMRHHDGLRIIGYDSCFIISYTVLDDCADRVRVATKLTHSGIFSTPINGLQLSLGDTYASRSNLETNVLGLTHVGKLRQKPIVIGDKPTRTFA